MAFQSTKKHVLDTGFPTFYKVDYFRTADPESAATFFFFAVGRVLPSLDP